MRGGSPEGYYTHYADGEAGGGDSEPSVWVGPRGRTFPVWAIRHDWEQHASSARSSPACTRWTPIWAGETRGRASGPDPASEA